MEQLLKEPAARVLTDAFAHCKFIGYVEPAQSLFANCGIDDEALTTAVSHSAASRDANRLSMVWADCAFGIASPMLKWGRELTNGQLFGVSRRYRTC